MNEYSVFATIPGIMHACHTSASTDISIPGNNMFLCIKNVSYKDGKIEFEANVVSASIPIQELVIFTSLNISHRVSDKKDTEPIAPRADMA